MAPGPPARWVQRRIGVHQPAGRLGRPADRGGRAEGVPDRHGARVGEARQLHPGRPGWSRRRRARADGARARRGARAVRGGPAHRGPPAGVRRRRRLVPWDDRGDAGRDARRRRRVTARASGAPGRAARRHRPADLGPPHGGHAPAGPPSPLAPGGAPGRWSRWLVLAAGSSCTRRCSRRARSPSPGPCTRPRPRSSPRPDWPATRHCSTSIAGAVSARIEQLPWVRSATVPVNWPDGVHIAVTERCPGSP